MADIVSSLILPNKTSQESFHSSRSHNSQLLPYPGTAAAHALTLRDVDEFLDDCQNQNLLSSKAEFEAAAGPKTSPHGEAPHPIPIGQTKSSQNIQTLYHLCQQRGITPEFEIDGETFGDWGGWLKINDHNISSDQRWSTKKAAREGLAEKAIEIVKKIEISGRPASANGQINWIGKLLEYHNVASPTVGPVYSDYAIGGLFACECSIPGWEYPFGSKENGFTTKKAARSNAAKEAVEYLISECLLNADGTIKTRKKLKVGAAVRVQGKTLNVERSASYSQRITDFCPILGLTAPTYHLSVASAATPSLLSGFASFPNSPNLPPRVGEVRNVYGKKNAKEECARGIWQELKTLARNRGVEVADSDGE